jgi:hypothetical protein
MPRVILEEQLKPTRRSWKIAVGEDGNHSYLRLFNYDFQSQENKIFSIWLSTQDQTSIGSADEMQARFTHDMSNAHMDDVFPVRRN